jgi:ubiquinone/menaquinone biosynthesis C-methylase UbiE
MFNPSQAYAHRVSFSSCFCTLFTGLSRSNLRLTSILFMNTRTIACAALLIGFTFVLLWLNLSSQSGSDDQPDVEPVNGESATRLLDLHDVATNVTAESTHSVPAALKSITVQTLNVAHQPWTTATGDGVTLYNPEGSAMTTGGVVVMKPVPRGGAVDPYHRQCPKISFRLNGKRPDDKKLMTAISKYSGYVKQYCNNSGMLQMHVTFTTYLSIFDKIASMIGLRQNQRVFDLGCGCGTTLNYLYRRFNITGTGVDLTSDAIDHAVRHAQPQQLFCHSEGARFLGALPSNYFDHAISWSVIHHIRRKQHQCAVAAEMVRVVKPGGYVFVGHLRGEHTIDYWTKKRRCNITGTKLRVLTDYRVFGVEAFRRNRYPSILLRKDGAIVATAGTPNVAAADVPEGTVLLPLTHSKPDADDV